MNSTIENKKHQIETFRKEDFGVQENGKIDIREHLRKGYDSAIRNLSMELYSKKIHFIFELIQNAQDNDYDIEVSKKIHFELLDHDPTNTDGCKGCLAVFNNEKGFQLNNIKAISTIGDSTKSNQKDLGYIGEKGIGFKSVFAVSPSPHIYSNGYQIYFKDKDPDTGLGYIIPYWKDEVPQVVSDRQQEFNTCILLPLKQSEDNDFLKQIEQELKQLDAAILMFLKKLNHITVLCNGYQAHYDKSRVEDTISIKSTINGVDDLIDFHIYEKTINVPLSINEEKRAKVTSREITISFPVDRTLAKTRLYAYLPTELSTGLPFLINADFLLPANRESVVVDNGWNIWMRDEVSVFVADTLSSLLEKSEDVSDFGLIPLIDNCNDDFLLPIFERTLKQLKNCTVLPNFRGERNVSNQCVFADPVITSLIQGLEVDDEHIKYKVLPICLHKYQKQISQLIDLEFSIEDFSAYLIAGIDILPSKNTDWFMSVYEWLSKQDFEWLYQDEQTQLLDTPLFLIEDGVCSRNETNLFESSNINIQHPKLATKDHELSYNLISQDLQKALLLNKPVNEFIKKYFKIEVLSQGEFLETVAFPFCSKNWKEISDSQLWELTHFVFQNWFSLSPGTKRLISSRLPLKNSSDLFELNVDKLKQVVVPTLDEKSFIWRTVFSKNEQKKFIILSDDYIKLFDSFEKLDKAEVFNELGITATPLPEKIEITKASRNGNPEIPEDQFGKLYSEYLHKKLSFIDSTSPIKTSIMCVPSICYQENKFQDTLVRKAFHAWLEGLERNSGSQVSVSGIWKKQRIPYFYQYSRGDSIDSELWQCVKRLKWLHTQNGCKRIDEVFIPSQSSRELYGNAVNFLSNEVSFSESLSKALNISADVNSDTVLKVLRSWSEHNENCSISDVTKIYERLADTRSDLNELFANESLIFCPSVDSNWCKTENAIWQSQKSVLGGLFHWLSDFYSIGKQSFWLNTVGVEQFPNAKSFADAWLELQTIPIQDNDKSRYVRDRLGAIYDRLIAYVRSVGVNNLDDWFQNFVSNARCFTQSYRWTGRFNVYISDDRRISDLLAPEGVEFFWRTRGKTHSDFSLLYEALRLKTVTEEIIRDVTYTREDLSKPVKPILTKHSRLLLAYYYKQFISKSKTVPEKWYEEGVIFDLLTVEEFTTDSSITVCYELNQKKASAEANVYFDEDNGWLVYKAAYQDEEDLIEDLAEEISKTLVTKAFVEEEDHIRPLLGVNSQKRLEKRINKKGWEKLLSKEEIEQIKLLKRPETDEGFTADEDESDPNGNNGTSSGGRTGGGTSNGGTPSAGNTGGGASTGGTSTGGSTSGGTSTGGTSSGGSAGGDSSTGGTSTGGSTGGGASTGGTSSGGSAGGDSSTGGTSNGGSTGGVTSTGGTSSGAYNPLGYRMVSYVESEEKATEGNRDSESSKKIGDKAELLVTALLEELGFKVTLYGGNNPGFDISAINVRTGEEFLVEVKGIRGRWNLTGFALSKTQVSKCHQYGDNYWLVVVEQLASTPIFHKISNPVSKIDAYCFDSNWRKIAETFDNVDLDVTERDLFYDEAHYDIYCKSRTRLLGEPEVGFEVQNEYGEIVAELELAWPKCKKGIYTDVEKPQLASWDLRTIAEVVNDLSWLDK
jgi:hypothetical protein